MIGSAEAGAFSARRHDGAARLEARLVALPRYRLVTAPTPLQPLRRLSAHLGGPDLWVKRDDLTGLAFGGNKVRQMEFFVGEAKAQGADVLIGGGSYAQSNHARIVSAAARFAGLEPVIVVRPGGSIGRYGGNALLTRMLCSDLRVVAELADAPRDRLAEVEARRAIFDAIADEYRGRGRKPYCIYGSSDPLGVMGYVAAAAELQRQFDEAGVAPQWVVVTSLGATQAGLELGSRLLGASWQVWGLGYQPVDGAGDATVARLFNEAARLLGLDLSVAARDLIDRTEWSGPDYAAPSPQSREAMRLAATLEALILDPVYSAKGMAGLIATIRSGVFRRDRPVVFVHTGGQVGLFAHSEDNRVAMSTDNRPIDAHAHVSSPDGVRFRRSDALPAAPRFDAPIEMLLRDMDVAGVGRSILIQPSFYGFDHSYLLECLAEHPSRFAGVALSDPADAGSARLVAQMMREAPIVGVRFAPLIDPSRPWFGAETDSLVETIADLDMAVCLLISPAYLEQATAWIARRAAPRIVIDHIGRPDLGAEGPQAVCERVARLSDYHNVWVKLSALPELSREPYPYRDTAVWARRMLAAFGPERLMWGSDFPFIAGATQYSASLSSLREALGEASPDAYQQIVARTAAEVFRLERAG